jgi:hypothetical protein
MINREILPYINNILSLHNQDVDMTEIYTILTAIQEDDLLSFFKSILQFENKNLNIEYLLNILQTIRHHRDLEDDILDSFSNNQVKAKSALLTAIDNLKIINTSSNVVIWGCWYGSILIPSLYGKVKRIIGIDIDETTIRLAKNSFFQNYKNVDLIVDDVFATYRNFYLETDLIINTSCEHMKPMNEWPWFQTGALENDMSLNKKFKSAKLSNNCHFAFQSNNMFDIEGHINCVNSMDEFKFQLPERAEILHQEEIVDERGTRYLLIGKFHAI